MLSYIDSFTRNAFRHTAGIARAVIFAACALSASVAFAQAPAFTSGPSSISMGINTEGEYFVAASNSPSYAFTWVGATLTGSNTFNTATGEFVLSPNEAGNFTLQVTASNGSGSAVEQIPVTVYQAPVFTSPSTLRAAAGSTMSFQTLASNSPLSFTVTSIDSNYQGTVTINSTSGVMTIAPTATGSFSVGIQAGNPGGVGNQTLTINVTAAGSAGWKTADMTGDGYTDIISHNSQTGELGFDSLTGLTDNGFVHINYVGAPWVVAGVADFNGDGIQDILWQNPDTGEVGVWLLNATNNTGSVPYVQIGFLPSGFTVAGVGDFNGDGKPDILIRNESTGEVDVWMMNGTSLSSSVFIAYVGSPWVIGGVGDFTNNGQQDVLWRNPTTGEVGVWLMSGTTVTNYITITYVGSPWVVVGVGDYNEDGNVDVLWYNPDTGETGAWLLDGDLNVTNYVVITNKSAPWTPIQ